MKLPLPTDKVAGCMWLARILEKGRLILMNELPAEYFARFGHPTGVDGVFLKHFGLQKEDIVKLSQMGGEQVVLEFRRYPGVTDESIAMWNEIAPNLGRSGYPMAERLPIALRTTYAHLSARQFDTVFEVLVADEA